MRKRGPLKKILADPPTLLVIVVLLSLIIYGAVSLVVEPEPDNISFSEEELQLDSQAWLELYEKRKHEQRQQQESSFYQFFAPDKGH